MQSHSESPVKTLHARSTLVTGQGHFNVCVCAHQVTGSQLQLLQAAVDPQHVGQVGPSVISNLVA